MQKFMCPRIRLTQTNGSRAIIPIDAISCITESKREKCVEVYTMDGFWYSVTNPILEIDKKIDEAIAFVNGGVESPKHQKQEEQNKQENKNIERYDNAKVAKFKRKRMLSAGIDKPARREAKIMESVAQPASENCKKEFPANDEEVCRDGQE